MLKMEVLNAFHEREAFDCGVEELNDYLKKIARQHTEKGLSRTFVLIDDELPFHILAYMTLVLCEVHSVQLPPKYSKKYPSLVPAAKLGRLAVLKNRQGQGLGKLLMLDAIKKVLIIANQAGIIGFFVDAKNDSALKFYLGYGFIPLPDNPFTLFIPIKTLQQCYSSSLVPSTSSGVSLVGMA